MLAVACGAAGGARAQLTTPVLQPVIPFNYSQGRNVSVTERDRPEYQAIGIETGGFVVYPRIDVGVGFTNNVFETNALKRSSSIVTIVPTVKAVSNWSQNSLQLEAGGDLRRYPAESVRDQNGWHVNLDGTYDLSATSSLAFSGFTARQYETRFSGSTPQDIASATPYQLSQAQLTGAASTGATRFTGVVNLTNANFSPITLLSGDRFSQEYRNRNVVTASGQIEYPLSAETSLFGQVSYTDTNYYDRAAIGLDDRSSGQVRAIAGISLDISALIRGSFGVGYSNRHYRSALYENVSGLSLESRFEYFPSELTTVTVAGRRAIEDSNVVGSPGFFNTGIGVQVDHELFRNLILNLGGDFEHDSFRQVDASAKVYVATGGAHYLISRSLGVSANMSYGRRRNGGLQTGSEFSETSGLVSIFVQR